VRNGASDGVWYWCRKRGELLRESGFDRESRRSERTSGQEKGSERREVVRRDGCKETCIDNREDERMREWKDNVFRCKIIVSLFISLALYYKIRL
jgi:hypothetical protein